MNMNEKNMLKKVTTFNTIVGLVFIGLSYMFFTKYTFVLFLGVVLAIFNFILNAIITEKLLLMKGHKVLVVLSFLLRSFLIALIGLLVFKQNKFNVVAYMLGYSTQSISLVLYGLSIKNE